MHRVKIKCKFKEVPNDTRFYVYLNPNEPKDCHTLTCYKEADGSVFNREFNGLKCEPEEPVFYYQ